jgi:hypothetical protein
MEAMPPDPGKKRNCGQGRISTNEVAETDYHPECISLFLNSDLPIFFISDTFFISASSSFFYLLVARIRLVVW